MDDPIAIWGEEPKAELAVLTGQEQNATLLRLANRHAPHILLDNLEPFQPLVTGYSVIRQDGPSPSFERHIRLGTSRGRAKQVIEYAIWWDWDINHLYELEHVWVYLGQNGEIIKVEGSWHGEVKDISASSRLTYENGHPVILAEPGKHAFGLSIDAFKAHQDKVPKMTSRYAGAQGTFLNSSFKNDIKRTPPGDRLVQTYLTRFAFTPSWSFSQTPVCLEDKLLIPWPTLEEWIPRRVNAWLKYLEQTIEESEYRYFRTAVCYSLDYINKARAHNLDVIQFGVGRNFWGLPVMIGASGKANGPNMFRILKACWNLMMGHHLIIHDARIIPWITRLLNMRDLTNYLMVGSYNTHWLTEVKKRAPNYRTVLLSNKRKKEIITLARNADANYIQFSSKAGKELSNRDIKAAHRAGIGIIIGPLNSPAELTQFRKMGVDSIVVQDATLFQQ